MARAVGGDLANFAEPLEEIANQAEEDVDPSDPEFLSEVGIDQLPASEKAKLGVEDAEVRGAEETEEPDIDSAALDEGDAGDEEVAEPATGQRANERIRGLVAERNSLKQALEQQQAQIHAQMQQQMALQQRQYQAQMQEIQRQNEMQRQQLELVQERDRLAREEAEYANMPPLQALELKAQRAAERTAVQKAREALAPELSQLEQRLQQREQQYSQFMNQVKQQRQLEAYTAKVQEARSKYILPNADPQADAELIDTMDSMLLAYISATGKSPDEAARDFNRHRQLDYSHQLGRVAAGRKGKQVARSRQTGPSVRPGAKKPQSARKFPSKEQLSKAGFTGNEALLDWMEAGEPPVQ